MKFPIPSFIIHHSYFIVVRGGRQALGVTGQPGVTSWVVAGKDVKDIKDVKDRACRNRSFAQGGDWSLIRRRRPGGRLSMTGTKFRFDSALHLHLLSLLYLIGETTKSTKNTKEREREREVQVGS